MNLTKPSENEYNPYFGRYICQVSDVGNFYDIFESNTQRLLKYFGELPSEKHDFAYAEGKWTVKQVLRHIIDTDRIFSYRLLVILRNDANTQIQEYDDDLYASNTDDSQNSLQSMLLEFESVRKSLWFLVQNMTTEDAQKHKKVGDYNLSARAIAYIVLGHALHHLSILKERY